MTAVPFDTAEYVDELVAANIPREQARAIVGLMRSSHEAADVATKHDIELLRKDMEGMRKDMEGMRKDIIIWLGGLVVGSFVVLGGMLIKLMP